MEGGWVQMREGRKGLGTWAELNQMVVVVEEKKKKRRNESVPMDAEERNEGLEVLVSRENVDLIGKHDAVIAETMSPETVKDLGIYVVTFDRPGYGKSDPNPKRMVKSMATDIEELADQLGFGHRFYVIGFSMGGQVTWSCLKFIPHSRDCLSDQDKELIPKILKGRPNVVSTPYFGKFRRIIIF
ncbi:hypothetical protein C1H46_031115 [Malus baccata]|uniref:AB hydrolase-1 domain-containing protein n=1 Tax=Malus baccata TaxID=106549 RepID=A0A540LA13_MALBA|nr:hypothetical protein C1H46_031115 [Malus baccata]